MNAIGRGYNKLPDLYKIECPSLVLTGTKDRHITVESSLETAKHLKNAEFKRYSDTAHLFPWEIPEEVLSDIDTWLAQHSYIFDSKGM
jgi:proline iminopeptidase